MCELLYILFKVLRGLRALGVLIMIQKQATTFTVPAWGRFHKELGQGDTENVGLVLSYYE